MRRFKMVAKGETCRTVDETFTSGITHDRAEEVLGLFPTRKATSGR
jgi:hypothetical protein